MNAITQNPNGEGNALVSYETAALLGQPRILTPPPGEPAPGQEYISLAAYWNVLLKRRWTVVTVALVLTTLVAIASFRAQPIFRAVSRVQVEPESQAMQSISDLYQNMYTDPDTFLQTQIQVLKSDTLAWQTAEQLKLGENPNFAGPATPNESPEDKKLGLIEAFQGQVSVELVPKTHMIMVGFESPDAKLAAQVSTALVNNYIDYNFRQRYDATRQVSGWMEQQLDDLKAKVEASQHALVDYERQNAIANTGDKQNVQEQMLSDLSRDLTTAQSDRIQKESLYNQVRDNRAEIAALAHNDLLQKLEETAADVQRQYTEAVNQYGPKFPKVVRLNEQLNAIGAQIEQEQNRVLERVHNDYVTAANREKLAMAAVGRQKDALSNVNQLLVQHNILQREFETNQTLYQSLLQKLKDATVSAGLRSTNIHMVDAALTPSYPVRPRKKMNIAMGLLAGLVLGIMLAFAQEGLDHSIKSIEEVEAMLGTPALGVIPLQRANRAAYGRLLKTGAATEGEGHVGLTILDHPGSVLAEAYRSLRTAILLSLAQHPPKTLLITSAQAGDGKTVTSLNLASALAQRRGPVLLVDCDLRKSGIARVLGINNEKGVSTHLTGTHTLDEVLQQYERLPNLWILPAGPTPPNAADLLSSEKMVEFIAALNERFEHVVIDSPPVMAVTDATILSRMVDGVVLVAQGGRTGKASLLRTRQILETAGARILGVLLNKYDLRQQGYYGGGYYHYGYGYGKKYPYPYGGHHAE